MRERAHSAGGHFRAERRHGGGFGVVAELPLRAQEAHGAERAKESERAEHDPL